MADADVKQLLLQVDASVELLRKNLNAGMQQVDKFTADAQRRLDASDRRFARFGQPLTGIGAVVANTNRQIASIGNSVENVERRMRASSANIRAMLLTATSGIASAITADRVAQLADTYTRFTNSLKVAGQEGRSLSQTQDELYATAQRYGVQLDLLGNLYGGISGLQKDLNATDTDTLRLTNAVAAAIKIKGSSAESAAGAIIGLNQALAQQRVQSDEYNQILDGARPLLQAAADASEKYRGSLARMKQDIEAGNVSGQDFFRILIAGYDRLQEQASKASLTISASFTVLDNALARYIGGTDAALSATERISQAIVGLSNNLDTIIPALAAIAAGYGAMKIGQAAFAGTTAAASRALDIDRAFAAQILRGNASYISRTQLQAASAVAAREAAAAEVSAIEATIVARRADQAALAEQIRAEAALAAERRAAATLAAASNVGGASRTAALAAQSKAENDAAFASQRLATARQRQVAVDAELAVAETALGGAQARAAAATAAADTATRAASVGARVAAGVTSLFAGTLTTLATALPIVAIGAFAAAIISFNQAAEDAEENAKAVAAQTKDLAEKAKRAADAGNDAATAISRVGSDAAANTGKVQTFAGAVGDAAQKLRELAIANKEAAVAEAERDVQTAQQGADGARNTVAQSNRTAFILSAFADPERELSLGGDPAQRAVQQQRAADANLAAATKNLATARANLDAAKERPLESYIRNTDRTGGRDLSGELDTAQQQLRVAQASGDKEEINIRRARVFELKRTLALIKDGNTFENASAQAAREASEIRNAGAGRLAAQGANRAETDREQAIRDAAADARAYASAQRQAENDIAAARARITNSIEERAAIEKARIDSEKANRDEEIRSQGPNGAQRYTAEQVATMLALNTLRANTEKQAVDAELQAERQRDALAIIQARADNERDALQSAANLADTARERREIELRLLDIAYQKERADLDAVLASQQASEAEKQIARERLASLGQRYQSDREGVIRQTEGQGEAYRREVNRTPEQINEAIEGIKVDGLRSLNDELADAIMGTRSLGDAFSSVANQIIADLIRIAIQQTIVKSISNAVFPGLGFSGGGQIPGFAGGGRIHGPGTGTSDSIMALVDGKRPIKVSNGEFIVNEEATRNNLGLLHAINAGRIKGFAEGGPVTPRAIFTPRVPSMRSIGEAMATRSSRSAVDVAVNVNAGPMFDATVENVALRTVAATAEPIMAAAEGRTLRTLRRPSLPGGLG